MLVCHKAAAKFTQTFKFIFGEHTALHISNIEYENQYVKIIIPAIRKGVLLEDGYELIVRFSDGRPYSCKDIPFLIYDKQENWSKALELIQKFKEHGPIIVDKIHLN